MSVVTIVVGALATWRVTHLLHAEAGPGDVFERFRRRVRGVPAGATVDCFLCLSLWIAAPVAAAIATEWGDWLLLWPALSALAIVFERLTTSGRAALPAYWEDLTGDDDDAMLRRRVTKRGGVAGGRAGSDDGRRDSVATAGTDGVHREQDTDGGRSGDW